MDDFISWTDKKLESKYKSENIPFSSDIAVERARDFVETNDHYSRAQKDDLLDALDHVFTRPSVTTRTKCFIKQETVFGDGWPRLVAAREDALRVLSSSIYSMCQN